MGNYEWNMSTKVPKWKECEHYKYTSVMVESSGSIKTS